MLLDPGDWSLAQRSDDVLPQLPPGLAAHVSAETHQGAIELATDPHATVGAAMDQLRGLRARLTRELRALGLAAVCAGGSPTSSRPRASRSPPPARTRSRCGATRAYRPPAATR